MASLKSKQTLASAPGPAFCCRITACLFGLCWRLTVALPRNLALLSLSAPNGAHAIKFTSDIQCLFIIKNEVIDERLTAPKIFWKMIQLFVHAMKFCGVQSNIGSYWLALNVWGGGLFYLPVLHLIGQKHKHNQNFQQPLLYSSESQQHPKIIKSFYADLVLIISNVEN